VQLPATTAKAAALEEFDEVVQAQIDQAPLNPDTTNEGVESVIFSIFEISSFLTLSKSCAVVVASIALTPETLAALIRTTTAQDLERVKNEEISKIENITDSTQTKMDAYNDVKQAATARNCFNTRNFSCINTLNSFRYFFICCIRI
jgi:epidermal growth factor receptor substrate 15